MHSNPSDQDGIRVASASIDPPLKPSLPRDGLSEEGQPHTVSARACLPSDPLVLPSSDALVIAELTRSPRLDAWLVPPHT
ncbi:MAG: hypothetical protein ACREIG_09015, partial [Nitrospiraceae bacterium]